MNFITKENLEANIKKVFIFKKDNFSISQMSKKANWSRSRSKLYANKLFKLTKEDIQTLNSDENHINEELLGAICLSPDFSRKELLKHFDDIQGSSNPFKVIDSIVDAMREKDPLSNLSRKYWFTVAKYLKERGIDDYPFKKKVRGFLYNIGKYGYENLSENQKKYIKGLLEKDVTSQLINKIFLNDFILSEGLAEDYQIIKEYFNVINRSN